MEKKTELLEEFGRTAQEFSGGHESGPDRSSEFNRAQDEGGLEFGGAYAHKEFFGRSSPAPAGKGERRREKKRRALLMQWAAVGLSAVVVTSSFGVDLLGDNQLFGGSSSRGTEAQLYMLTGEEGELPEEMDPVFLYRNGRLTTQAERYRDTVRYDPGTNTLVLDSCDVEGPIVADYMGADFTVYLEGDCRVGQLRASNCGLTVDGSPGSALAVNHQEDYDWGIGVAVDAGGEDYCLTVKPGITVDVKGLARAVHVNETTAGDGIVCEGTRLSGGTIICTPLSEDENSGEMVWTVQNGNEPAQNVVFSGGYRVAGSGIYVTPEYGAEPVAVFADGQLTDQAGSLDGVSYDPGSGIITLSQFGGEAIEIFDLPQVTVEVYGENRVGRIYSTADLILGGDPYGKLIVNEEKRYRHGVLVDADGADHGLLVKWGPEIEVFGQSAAVAVYDSALMNALRREDHVKCSGLFEFGDFVTDRTALTSDIRTVRSWTVFDASDERCDTHVLFARDSVHGPSADAELSVSVNGTQVVLFENGRPTGHDETLNGIAYDFKHNTLVLDRTQFDTIRAFHMGEGFTINLLGENAGKQITSIGSADSANGNLHIRGDGWNNWDDGGSSWGYEDHGSLELNAAGEPHGILLEANGGTSELTFGWLKFAHVVADQTAVLAKDTEAEVGLYAGYVLDNGQVGSLEENGRTSWSPVDWETDEFLAEVYMAGGYGGGMEAFELNGINVMDWPSSEAKRWIGVDYRWIYVDSEEEQTGLESVEGMTFDENTNTLTLTNCSAGWVETTLMGDDFTINLVGDNVLGGLYINASNVTFSGYGSLTIGGVRAYQSGFVLEAQNREHFVAIEPGVSLYIQEGFSIHATTAQQPVLYRSNADPAQMLVRNAENYSYYEVDTNFAAGAANYSFVRVGQPSGEFTRFERSQTVTLSGVK